MPPRNVDDAFTEAYRSHRIEQGDDASTLPPPLKRRKGNGAGVDPSSSAGGGGGGGFVVDSDDDDIDDGEEEQPPAPDYLPLSEVPHALSILSLPSDDDGILTVFRTAAVNDPNAPRRRAGAPPPIKVISREDFARVCEVLMDGDDEENEQAQDSRRRRRPQGQGRPSRLAAAKQRRAVEEAQSISSDSDDVYQASEDGQEDDDDEDDEGSDQAAAASSSRRRRRKRAADSDEEEAGQRGVETATMTAEQREHAQGAWQLFADKLEEVYPEWDGQTIGKRELHRLAISVGEKLSDKDVSVGALARIATKEAVR